MSPRVLRSRNKIRAPKRYHDNESSDSPESPTLPQRTVPFDPTLTAAFPTLDHPGSGQDSTGKLTMTDNEAGGENNGAKQRPALVFRAKQEDSSQTTDEEELNVEDPGTWEDMESDDDPGEGGSGEPEAGGQVGMRANANEAVKWSSISPGMKIIILNELIADGSALEDVIRGINLTDEDIAELIEIREHERFRMYKEDAEIKTIREDHMAKVARGEVPIDGDDMERALEAIYLYEDGSQRGEDPLGWINKRSEVQQAERFLLDLGMDDVAGEMYNFVGVGEYKGFHPVLYMVFPGEEEEDPKGKGKGKGKSGMPYAKGLGAAKDDNNADSDEDHPQKAKHMLSGKAGEGLSSKKPAKKKRKVSKNAKQKLGLSGLRNEVPVDDDEEADSAGGPAEESGIGDTIGHEVAEEDEAAPEPTKLTKSAKKREKAKRSKAAKLAQAALAEQSGDEVGDVSMSKTLPSASEPADSDFEADPETGGPFEADQGDFDTPSTTEPKGPAVGQYSSYESVTRKKALNDQEDTIIVGSMGFAPFSGKKPGAFVDPRNLISKADTNPNTNYGPWNYGIGLDADSSLEETQKEDPGYPQKKRKVKSEAEKLGASMGEPTKPAKSSKESNSNQLTRSGSAKKRGLGQKHEMADDPDA